MNTLFTGSFIIVGVIILVVLVGAAVGIAYVVNLSNSKVLTEDLSEPLPEVTTAKVDINTGSGNLAIDTLTGGEQVLASGMLEYLEKRGLPTHTLSTSNGQAVFSLNGGDSGRPDLHLPWSSCNAATNWQIHLNPTIPSDLTAYSGGGNLKLNLAGMTITRLLADSGGGNLDVVLPENASNLDVTARTGGGKVTVDMGNGTTGRSTLTATSGAGEVVVLVPGGIAAKVYATTGMGKVIMDPRFSQIDKNTYQSLDYDSAATKVEITVKSGAGNVTVSTK